MTGSRTAHEHQAQVPDSAQRREALDTQRSFICEAPAGSGKTELLTQRYLALLAKVTSPEEILAMTFTRKAAAEMRTRVVRALSHAAATEEAPASEHERNTWALARAALQNDHAQGWNVIETPGRLHILTFDSLCAWLANTLAIHSSFTTAPPIAEDAEQLYTHAVQTFLASIEEEVPWSPALATILHLLDNNQQKLQALLITMLARREAWLPLFGSGADVEQVLASLEENLQQVRSETIAHVKHKIPIHEKSSLVSLSVFAANNVIALASNAENKKAGKKTAPTIACADLQTLPDDDDQGVAAWQGIVHWLFTASGTWRKKLDKSCGFPVGENAEEKRLYKEKKQQALALIESLQEIAGMQDALQAIRTLPSARYAQDQRKLLIAVIEILPIVGAYLGLSFKEKNAVDFTEVSIKARMAMGRLDSPSELALAMDYKIQHILVDEFQDTSPSQIDLLNALTAGWEYDDGRTLFCVGDAMQSIYGFRDANVGLFLRCVEQGLNNVALIPLRLNSNFRSQAGVVAWVNATFARAFPQENEISVGAVSYSPSVAFDQTKNDHAVAVKILPEHATGDDEAEEVVKQVREAQGNFPGGSIGILVRNRPHIADIAPALDRAGLRYHAVDLEPLQNRSIIQDLMALTHALLRPADRIAWLAVLRAPWCGLLLHDLHGVANCASTASHSVLQQAQKALENDRKPLLENGQVDLFAEPTKSDSILSEDGCQRLSRVVPVLSEAVQQRQRKALRHWVEGTWLALGGAACLRSEQEKRDAQLFFSLLEKLDDNTLLSQHDALENAIKKLYAQPDVGSDDTLQIMTIHKAKGLEFDTVIVPQLQRAPRSDDPELLRWFEHTTHEGKTALLLSAISASGRDKDPVDVHLAAQKKKRDVNETCRLLYVACTRARQRLVLLAQLNNDEKSPSGFKAPNASSLFSSIWPVVEQQIEPVLVPEPSVTDFASISTGELCDSRRFLHRLPIAWQCPKVVSDNLLRDYVPYFAHDNTGTLPQMGMAATERLLGTYAHRLLKGLQANTLASWRSDEECEAYCAQHSDKWCRELAAMGVPKTEQASAVAKIRRLVISLASDTARHWLFSNTHTERKTEYEISCIAAGGVKHYILDLLIVDGESTWIVDYKTSEPAPDQDQQDFVVQAMQTYRDIMFHYKTVIEKMGYANVRLALYFPMISTWTEYD